jgi:nucleotide-binding universal stress UspA family protein
MAGAYRNILVATDGSPRSRAAVCTATALARAGGGRLTGIFVVAEGVPTLFSGSKLYGSGVMSAEYRNLARLQAREILAEVERAAAQAGVVACRVVRRLARHPWRAILATARAEDCDLVVMASRGHAGMEAVLLGSETNKLLAHSKIPVLVCR